MKKWEEGLSDGLVSSQNQRRPAGTCPLSCSPACSSCVELVLGHSPLQSLVEYPAHGNHGDQERVDWRGGGGGMEVEVMVAVVAITIIVVIIIIVFILIIIIMPIPRSITKTIAIISPQITVAIFKLPENNHDHLHRKSDREYWTDDQHGDDDGEAVYNI